MMLRTTLFPANLRPGRCRPWSRDLTNGEPMHSGKRILKAVATGAVILAPVVGTTATASAAVAPSATQRTAVNGSFSGQCWSGIDSWGNGEWAWGACTGYGTFRLRVSCTWGQN